MAALGRFLPVQTAWSGQASAHLGWNRVGNPMQMTGQVECKSVVRLSANGWSYGVQFRTRPAPHDEAVA